MQKRENQGEAERLSRLLSEARPSPDLPPRFRETVWRRIERAERESGTGERFAWLESLVSWIVRPRLAVAGALTVILLGGVVGVMAGAGDARQDARDRYVAAVAPQIVR